MIKWRPLLAVLILASPAPVYAEVGPLPHGISYGAAKTWHEQLLAGNPSKLERLEAQRALTLASPLGQVGTERVFRNFSPSSAVDPRIPGVDRTVLMQLSNNAAQAKGYRRQYLYARAFQNDRRFVLEALDRPLRRPWGNTDADLVIRHRLTGRTARIEVKDYSRRSQARNLSRLKRQMEKMAHEARLIGERQFWVNRRSVLPEIARYGKAHGIHVIGNVSTGKSGRGSTVSVRQAIDEVERSVRSSSSRTFDTSTLWRGGELRKTVVAGRGIPALVFLGIEGWLLYQHRTGRISTQEFWTDQWIISLTAAGGGLGWWIGAPAGATFGQPVLVGILSSLVGGWAGNAVGRRTARWYFELKYGELDRAYGEAVYRVYGM